MYYAGTQVNLGIAYANLSKVQDKTRNGNLAIKAYQEARKVYNKKEFPKIYRLIEENIKN